MRINSYISGKYSTKSNQAISKKNPFTSEELHQFYSADLLEAVTAIQQSQKFFLEYKQSTISDRLQILKRIKAYIVQHQIRFAKLEAQDQGLPLSFVLQTSIRAILDSLDHVMAELSSSVKDDHQKYSAVGVISLICSWNLSFRIISERLFPAIAAGNTVVIKVSSMSPITAVILAEMIEMCPLPSGLVQVIVSVDPEVKKILVTHPGVKAISFVGQLAQAHEVLKLVASVGAQQFKKLQIAAGTKNTAAALGEPDTLNFQNIMDSFLIGQGQLAWNSSRLFVIEKNELGWLEKIKDYLAKLKPSEAIEDHSPWTPVLKPESFKTFDEISALAVSDQARLLRSNFTLNEDQKKNFLPITFTQDMSNCSTLQQDQVMAPLFILSTVKYAFDIQKYSNVSYFGFAAHLWGDDEKLAKIADSLEVGVICKNKWSAQIFGPVKSVKQSGFGLQDYRVFGDFFSNIKIVT